MNTSSNADPTSASATSPIPAAGSSCNRGWCVMDKTPEEHYDHHCSEAIDLASDGSGAWLVQRFAAGEPVKVAFEVRVTDDEADSTTWERFELEVGEMETLLRVLDDPAGRAGVDQLLAWFD